MSAFERKVRRAGANGPVVTEEAVAAFAEALRSDPGLLGALWKIKRWTEAALAALEVGFDGERVTIPERDGGGALTGLVRYAPEPLRENGVPKSIADAGSVRELFPRLVDESVAWLVEGEPDAITARSAGLPAIAVPRTQGWKAAYAERFRGVDVERRGGGAPEPGDPAETVMAAVGQDRHQETLERRALADQHRQVATHRERGRLGRAAARQHPRMPPPCPPADRGWRVPAAARARPSPPPGAPVRRPPATPRPSPRPR
jgi:hypothetical protein